MTNQTFAVVVKTTSGRNIGEIKILSTVYETLNAMRNWYGITTAFEITTDDLQEELGHIFSRKEIQSGLRQVSQRIGRGQWSFSPYRR